MRKRIIVTYIICIHLFLGVVLLRTNFIDRVERRVGISKTQSELMDYFNLMLRFHIRMDGNVPNHAVIFIGDSITQGLCVSAVVSPSVNYGIAGDTTLGVLKRLPMYSSIERASAVVVAIGVNDLKFRSNEEILKNYSKIAHEISKKVTVIFSAVLPVDEKLHCKWWHGMNDRIKRLNSGLERLTRMSDNLFFVDASPYLVDTKGNLADMFHDSNGEHLNSQGNAIWISKLQEAIKIARQDPSVAGGVAALYPRK